MITINKIKGFLLFLVAQITSPIVNIIGMLYACFKFKTWEDANNYYLDMAISKDQNSNCVNKYFFDDIMTKGKDFYHFGNKKETISSVFGKNLEKNTLSLFGRFWNMFLNDIQKNHSILSIGNTVTDQGQP